MISHILKSLVSAWGKLKNYRSSKGHNRPSLQLEVSPQQSDRRLLLNGKCFIWAAGDFFSVIPQMPTRTHWNQATWVKNIRHPTGLKAKFQRNQVNVWNPRRDGFSCCDYSLRKQSLFPGFTVIGDASYGFFFSDNYLLLMTKRIW